MVTRQSMILLIEQSIWKMVAQRSFVVKIEVVMNVKAAVAFEAGKPLTIETVQFEDQGWGGAGRDKATCLPTPIPSGADPEGLFPAILGHEVQALS